MWSVCWQFEGKPKCAFCAKGESRGTECCKWFSLILYKIGIIAFVVEVLFHRRSAVSFDERYIKKRRSSSAPNTSARALSPSQISSVADPYPFRRKTRAKKPSYRC